MKRLACAGLIVLASCSPQAGPLVPDDAIVGDAIPASLTGQPGDASRGRTLFVERDGGHCLLCHAVASLDAPFHGDVGPDLTAIGDRLTPGQIRLRLVDASRLNPDTVMPPYHRVHDLSQVEHGQAGQPVLSSQEIEDLVAWLSTLKEDRT